MGDFMMDALIRLHETDNLVIALTDLATGASVPGVTVPLPGPVPRGHKLATRAIAKGEIILRYGQSIGQATDDIVEGGHIHTHNRRGRGCQHGRAVALPASGIERAAIDTPARRQRVAMIMFIPDLTFTLGCEAFAGELQ